MPAKNTKTTRKPSTASPAPVAPAPAAPAAPASDTPPAAPDTPATATDELDALIAQELGQSADDQPDQPDETDQPDGLSATDDTDLPATDDTTTTSDQPLPADDAHAAGEDDGSGGTGDSPVDGAAASGEPSDPAAQPDPTDDKIAALEAQIADLTARLAAGQQPPAAPRAPQTFSAPEDEVASAETPEDLQRLHAKFTHLQDLALDNPEGLELAPATPGGEPRIYTPEQMRSIAQTARRALRSLPQQAQLLQQRANFDALADKAYPDYAKADSPLSRYYTSLRADPRLRGLPYLKLILGDAERGRLAREAAEKAAAAKAKGDGLPGSRFAPTARAAAPVLPSGGARRPAPATAAQAKAAATRKRIENTGGSEAALADELAARFGG